MKVTYPSADFPPLCSVSIDVPDGWRPGRAPNAVLVLFDEESPAHFRTNLTVALERTVGPADLASIAQRARERGGDETTPQRWEPTTLGGYPAHLQVQTIEHGDTGVVIFQAQCLVHVPTAVPDLGDLVIAHASCAADQADRYGPLFRAAFESMTFSPAEAGVDL